MARLIGDPGKHPRARGSSRSGAGPEAPFGRRRFLGALAGLVGAGLAPGIVVGASSSGDGGGAGEPAGLGASLPARDQCLDTRSAVGDPQEIVFPVRYRDQAPIRLAGHFWYSSQAANSGRKCPAIVELSPYRRRDGMMVEDSAFYPYFAFHEYLCFRVDLQGSGDSEGLLEDEYTDEELAYCVQVIEQIAGHPWCDGNVGMMGTSWSAINSLMVAARDDCPAALKAILAFCGTDDRFSDDVHYRNGAMTQDNEGWASSMFGWLSLPPDPVIVGERWKEMWRQRLRGADYWFKWWGAHQTRDSYWSDTSLLGRYDRVKVPVFIVSGYADGYKNPVPRAVEGLSAAGMPVQAVLGPWGHSTADPGPHFDWLPVARRWWDRWLKGTQQDAEAELPQLTVWLGESKEPDQSCCPEEAGRWVAEDAGWRSRAREEVLFLGSAGRLTSVSPSQSGCLASAGRPLLLTNMLETSSYGHCGNDDLPGNQARGDRRSLCFDSAPLLEDMDCFGYPEVSLNLACDTPVASVAVRLCEVSPHTGASHLVSHRFYNLCYRRGDLSSPEAVEPGAVFSVRIPLDVTGHTFKRGWRIRLAVSPSFFPTMWESRQTPVLTVFTGPVKGLTASRLAIPRRAPRDHDLRMAELLPRDAEMACVDSEQYVPTLVEGRPACNVRRVEPFAVDGSSGVLVHKIFDSGRYQYGGPLQGLWVDEVATESFRMLDDDPLSLEGLSSFKATLERGGATGTWRVRCQTACRVWTQVDREGVCRLRYSARLQTFVADRHGVFEPFEEKTVVGSIPRLWV